MWHKVIWKGHPMRLELIRVGLLVEFANHYTTKGALDVNKVKRFQILLCFTNNSFKNQSFVYTHIKEQTVLFQTIQIESQTVLFDSLIRPIRCSHSKSGWSVSSGRVFRISQCSGVTEASPSDCLVSYAGYSLRESYPPREKCHCIM